MSISTVKLGLMLFWGLWLGLVLLNNVFEGLRALRIVTPYWNQQKAAKQFSIPESEIVVGEIAVGYHAELIGTIRGWEATALVGRKATGAAAQAAPEWPS